MTRQSGDLPTILTNPGGSAWDGVVTGGNLCPVSVRSSGLFMM